MSPSGAPWSRTTVVWGNMCGIRFGHNEPVWTLRSDMQARPGCVSSMHNHLRNAIYSFCQVALMRPILEQGAGLDTNSSQNRPADVLIPYVVPKKIRYNIVCFVSLRF